MAYKPCIVVVQSLSLIPPAGKHNASLFSTFSIFPVSLKYNTQTIWGGIVMKINVYFFLHNLHNTLYTNKRPAMEPHKPVYIVIFCHVLFIIVHLMYNVYKVFYLPDLFPNLCRISVHDLKMSWASPRRCAESSGPLSSGSERFGSYLADPEPPYCR